MGIMDQIANPQMADIAGALDYRQKRLDADEQKRKEIRIGQLVAEAVPGLKEGSTLHQLATESPKDFAAFAKASGVPLNSGEQFQQLSDDVNLLYTTAQADPYGAVEAAQQLKAQRNEQGRDTPQLDRWLSAVEQDPQTAFTGLFTMHRVMNSGNEEKPAGLREFEGMTEGLSDEERDKARRIKLGLESRAVGSADQTIAERGTAESVGESKAVIEDRVTRSKKNAENATGQIKEYFSQLESINSNIANYNEAIDLVKEGAGVGAIQSKLPSIRAASVKLDNVQSRLGLDVIGNTTFGALSESELKFALSSALPQKLQGEELREWLVQKRDAQSKVADYIDNAIQFLNIPGNSLADLQATNPQGSQQEGRSRQEPADDGSQSTQGEDQGGIKFLGFE